MLLTGKQLAMKLNVHITTIRRACRNDHIPYERLGKLYFFDLDRVRQAMQRHGADVLNAGDGLRATDGDSRRRAQPTRPRLGKTGASIANKPRGKK
ncbi:MAG: helix-turn-helix domain-containing protein [Nitrospira sp.]|jgi:excisionase family DNA binding protein|nr:helix-turn-helix domain-containing protein [Nitrospira sp.]